MATGTLTTYNLNVGIKLDVEDLIYIISPTDVPLQGSMGSDGRSALSSTTIFEKKYSWLDELLLLPNGVTGALLTTGVTTSTLTLAVATTFTTTGAFSGNLNFQTGDVLVIGPTVGTTFVTAENVLVTAIGANATDVTVQRAFQGTTQVQWPAGTPVKGVGMALAEGSDAPAARALDRVQRDNYSQIFGPTTIQVSGTENAIQKYGLTGTEFDKQIANRVKETHVAIEQMLTYGTAWEGGSTTNNRTSGGMAYYITSNIDNVTTTLTDSTLIAQLKACYDAGGSPDRMLVGSQQKQRLSQINSGNIRYAQDTNIRGQKIDYYDSDFGRQMLMMSRWVRPSDLFLFSRDQATIATLRPLTFEMLAKTGDSTKGMVIGEKGFYFRRQSWSAMFNNLV